jgi:ring-1,2-phenylacetyl-CoA epoxidase subunit PaaE
MAPKFHELTIREIHPESDDSVAITFDVPSALKADYAFTPGQYLTLRATVDGADVRRSYSISSPLGADGLTVGVRRVDDGVFSSYANDVLKAGDALQVMTPEGNFTAKAGGTEKYLLLAAGSGITPMMSIAASTLEASPDSEVTLVYGNRTTGSVMFREALEFLKDRHLGRMTLIHVLSREEQDVPLLNGRVDADKVTALVNVGAIDPAGADAVFICGPGEMIDEVAGALETLGVPKTKIRTEHFTPAEGSAPRKAPSARAKAAAAQGVAVEVILDGVRKSFTVENAEDSVLEAAHKQGLELPYSCQGGMCCTCRCRVVNGTSEMAVNYSLEPWEVEAGYTLACQTRATSDKLVLDFDHI